MKTKLVLLAALLVALLAVDRFAARARAQLIAEKEAANRASLTEETNLRLATERRSLALEQRAAAEKQIASLKQTPAPATGTSPSAVPPRVPTIDERLRTEPDVQVLWLKLQRAQVEATYGSLFRTLGLSLEQISRFEKNVIRKMEQRMDLTAISTEQKKNGGSGSAETAEALQRSDLDYKAAQRALLGDSAFQELQDYERTTLARKWVNGWAGGATVYLGEPLTQDQGDQLVQILANANQGYRRGGDFDRQTDWAAVEAAAQQILTPRQFRLFAAMEPPLPHGGRFQSQLYERILAAAAAEVKTSNDK